MKLVKAAFALAGVFIAVSTAVACSSSQQPVDRTVEPQSNAPQDIQVAPALQVPDGNTLVGTYNGSGVQIYQCVKKAWTLLEPAATLSEQATGNDQQETEQTTMLHFKGPIWVSTVDGSEVGATQVPGAQVNHDDAIPEILLKANENNGHGVLEKVEYVQRLNTRGGLAPTGSCADGAQQAVPYQAIYQFWVPAA
jgi:Protein of unknown function (DUF3455)